LETNFGGRGWTAAQHIHVWCHPFWTFRKSDIELRKKDGRRGEVLYNIDSQCLEEREEQRTHGWLYSFLEQGKREVIKRPFHPVGEKQKPSRLMGWELQCFWYSTASL
jgi:hypothetical protein